jgi:hypothetical protein
MTGLSVINQGRAAWYLLISVASCPVVPDHPLSLQQKRSRPAIETNFNITILGDYALVYPNIQGSCPYKPDTLLTPACSEGSF